MGQHSEILIVLDPHYGDRLHNIAANGPVWIVDTPDNRKSFADGTGFVTNSALFKMSDPQCRRESLLKIIPDIADHFGTSSFPDGDYRQCRVIGLPLSEKVREELNVAGVHALDADENGFVFELPE
jgi:hypothetical protein